jgi:hypothetical protein
LIERFAGGLLRRVVGDRLIGLELVFHRVFVILSFVNHTIS